MNTGDHLPGRDERFALTAERAGRCHLVHRSSRVVEPAGRAGRDPDSLEIVNSGIWRMLDIRDGLNAEQMRDDVGHLAGGGTDWITFNLCGDDPNASVETLQWFSEEIIAG